MGRLAKIDLVPARERVASSIRDAIFTRELEEGEVISLNELSSQLGVSYTPVREALQRLEQDGLVQLRPNKGAIVLGINRKYLEDYYCVRAILEREAAYLAASAADKSPLIQAFAEEERCVAAGQYRDFKECNRVFHLSIWKLSGNQRLENTLSSMWIGTSQGMSISERDYVLRSHNEHNTILQTILQRVPDKSQQLMDEHIKRSMNDILTHF